MTELRLGDLSKLLTVEDVQKMLEELVEQLIEETVPGRIEHWTDDEGLHRIPFEKDLKEEIESAADGALERLVIDKARDPGK